MLHKIRKQVMDLTISGRLDAFRAQHLAGPFYYRQLLPALEKIFNELSTEDEVTGLDKLELDLGIILPAELEATTWNGDWEKILRQQIQTALQDQRKNANPQRTAVNTNSCGQWMFYLQHGYLGWAAGSFNENTMQPVLEVLATDYVMVEKLRKLIASNKNTLLRIVNDNNETFLINLVEILTASAQQTLPGAVDELVTITKLINERLNSVTPSSNQLQQAIWLEIIAHASTSTTNLSAEKLVEAVLLSKKEIPLTILHMDELAKAKIIQPVLRRILENKIKTHSSPETKDPKKPSTEKPPGEAEHQTGEINEEGIYVSNAGLVLLHPFLSTFFKRLNLVSDGKFRDTAATEKAIHLLHYLASGQTAPQEHELVIPKLLCALPIHVALKESIELMHEEKTEADDLLLAVIEKWEKLKNVSIDALRENFLIRTGKLYTKNDMRYLQVEGGALDVLLDYLPWTLSIMKLPWMKEMVRIEWR